MKKHSTESGFTLVEIMIVVAIIALLAAIAIPNLLRARLQSNDAMARETLKIMATVTETYSTSGFGNYPSDMNSLTSPVPPYIGKNYCDTVTNGYSFTCVNSPAGYTYVATPSDIGSSGSTTFTVTTGSILTP